MTRAAHAAAKDAIVKLTEIAAKAHGGKPEAYKVAGGKVSGPGGSMTFAQAAQKAIEYGGKFDGHELPEDINNFTKTSAKNLVGQGLMAVAKDAYPRDGQSQSFVVGFAVYPFAAELFREAGIPKRLIPATMSLGSFTFAMDDAGKWRFNIDAKSIGLHFDQTGAVDPNSCNQVRTLLPDHQFGGVGRVKDKSIGAGQSSDSCGWRGSRRTW